MPRRASFPRERRRRTDAGMPALRWLEAERPQPAHRTAQKNHDLGRGIEPRIEPMAGCRDEAKLARDAAVERVEELSDCDEHQCGNDAPRREHDSRGGAHAKRRPRHLIGREPEGDVHESQDRADAAVYSGAKNRSKFIHNRTTMRTASLVLSETPTRNP